MSVFLSNSEWSHLLIILDCFWAFLLLEELANTKIFRNNIFKVSTQNLSYTHIFTKFGIFIFWWFLGYFLSLYVQQIFKLSKNQWHFVSVTQSLWFINGFFIQSPENLLFVFIFWVLCRYFLLQLLFKKKWHR